MEMEHLLHDHPLILVDLQPQYPHYEQDYDEDDDKENDVTTKQDFRCPCVWCKQEINWYHRYYYKCTYSCDYLIHKFCKNVKDGVALEEKKIYHPSHPHPLVFATSKHILCECDACGKEHKGIFYHCITCADFSIHRECAFLPKRLIIQQTTDDIFSHVHPLTISYSFSSEDQDAKFDPRCRICNGFFNDTKLWIYRCEKCWYYAHMDCATSRREPFMSIFSSPGLGKTFKNYKDVDHPDLLHLPFPDQTYSILKHLFFKETGCQSFETDEGNITHTSHQHPLILVHSQPKNVKRPTSSTINLLFCHNPIKKIELLCNGCIRPITIVPFYKCANEDQCCNFVLHEWCVRLPVERKNHHGHPQHTLTLLPKIPSKFLGVFNCAICYLPCNGFVYSCIECEYYIDVHCAFIPEKITHKAHPNHLLSRVEIKPYKRCRACVAYFYKHRFSFSCHTCDFDLHFECALLLPQKILHKYDKHPMNLSYFPIENHNSQYFCENCEEEFDPEVWFYHCYECVQSMHSTCAPVILQSEAAFSSINYERNVYMFLNIKFQGIHNIKHHEHPLSFVQGIESDGSCRECGYFLHNKMIFRCSQCKFAIDYKCCEELSNL